MSSYIYFNEEELKEWLNAKSNSTFESMLKTMMRKSYDSGSDRYEIMIKPEDCGAYSLNWVTNDWQDDWGQHYEPVDAGQQVMTEYRYPDGHHEWHADKEEFDESLGNWLESEKKEDRVWRQTDYGAWYEENEAKVAQECLRQSKEGR